MLREFRRVWCEDRYRVLQVDREAAYCGRQKGENYLVYRISFGSPRRRALIQSVNLEQDWYWNSELRRLTAEAAEIAPGYREEDVLRGYRYVGPGGEFEVEDEGLADLSDAIRVHRESLSYAEATFYLPAGASRFLVSLHGGPESFEGSEIRYGGGYRDLLRAGVAVVVLNYSGSKKRDGTEIGGRRAWGRWRESVAFDFGELMECGGRFGMVPERTSVFGASFGGALALSLSRSFSLAKVFLSSPLLDLNTQMRRGGEEFREWFETRFSAGDLADFGVENLASGTQAEVFVTFGVEDEVLGTGHFVERPKWRLFPRPGAHLPRSYEEYRHQREFFARIALHIFKS